MNREPQLETLLRGLKLPGMADMLGERTDADAYLGVAAQRYRLLFTHEWSEDVLARLRSATAR